MHIPTFFPGNVSESTRTAFRNGYGEKLVKNSSCSRQLTFVGLGNNGENVSVNVVGYQNTELLHLRITDAKKGLDKNLIITPQGIIKKSSSAVNTSVAPRVLGNENIYRREEIDDLEIIPALRRLKDELGEYHSYVEKRVEKAGNFKASYGRRCDPPETFVKPAGAASDMNPEQMIKFIQSQINQVRIELNKNLRLMMTEITSAASKSFRTFGETANRKLNELQENLMSFVDKR